MEGDRREVSLSLKHPVIMSQASLVKQISENVPSVLGPPGSLIRDIIFVVVISGESATLKPWGTLAISRRLCSSRL